MNLLGISGSLRSASTNTRLLHAATSLMPANATLVVESGLSQLPHFNPDLDVTSVAALAEFVDRVRNCSGIVFSSPVYAGGYPGTLKNALDWLVGTDAFVEKPFMMLSASNRVPVVEQSLVTVLETMSGVHIQVASITVPLLGTTLSVTELIADAGLAGAIQGSMRNFVDAIG